MIRPLAVYGYEDTVLVEFEGCCIIIRANVVGSDLFYPIVQSLYIPKIICDLRQIDCYCICANFSVDV